MSKAAVAWRRTDYWWETRASSSLWRRTNPVNNELLSARRSRAGKSYLSHPRRYYLLTFLQDCKVSDGRRNSLHHVLRWPNRERRINLKFGGFFLFIKPFAFFSRTYAARRLKHCTWIFLWRRFMTEKKLWKTAFFANIELAMGILIY